MYPYRYSLMCLPEFKDSARKTPSRKRSPSGPTCCSQTQRSKRTTSNVRATKNALLPVLSIPGKYRRRLGAEPIALSQSGTTSLFRRPQINRDVPTSLADMLFVPFGVRAIWFPPPCVDISPEILRTGSNAILCARVHLMSVPLKRCV